MEDNDANNPKREVPGTRWFQRRLPWTETQIGCLINCIVYINIYDRHQHKREIFSYILGLVGPSRGQLGQPSTSGISR